MFSAIKSTEQGYYAQPQWKHHHCCFKKRQPEINFTSTRLAYVLLYYETPNLQYLANLNEIQYK